MVSFSWMECKNNFHIYATIIYPIVWQSGGAIMSAHWCHYSDWKSRWLEAWSTCGTACTWGECSISASKFSTLKRYQFKGHCIECLPMSTLWIGTSGYHSGHAGRYVRRLLHHSDPPAKAVLVDRASTWLTGSEVSCQHHRGHQL